MDIEKIAPFLLLAFIIVMIFMPILIYVGLIAAVIYIVYKFVLKKEENKTSAKS